MEIIKNKSIKLTETKIKGIYEIVDNKGNSLILNKDELFTLYCKIEDQLEKERAESF